MALSGGMDSAAALYFLRQGRRRPAALVHVNHNTGEYANRCHEYVAEYAKTLGVDILDCTIPKHQSGSKEAYWREERYKWFAACQGAIGLPIVLGHHLDDCVEQYVINKTIRFSNAFTIPYRGQAGTIRPFRTWRKSSIKSYVIRHDLMYFEDPSNTDSSYTRNRVRKNLMPEILDMNPGLYKRVVAYMMDEAAKEPDNVVI